MPVKRAMRHCPVKYAARKLYLILAAGHAPGACNRSTFGDLVIFSVKTVRFIRAVFCFPEYVLNLYVADCRALVSRYGL